MDDRQTPSGEAQGDALEKPHHGRDRDLRSVSPMPSQESGDPSQAGGSGADPGREDGADAVQAEVWGARLEADGPTAPAGLPAGLGSEPEEPDPVADLQSQAMDRAPGWRQLHPLPRGLVEFYGLLAVLFVLVPEWMANGALFGFREVRDGSSLPPPSAAWRRLPELRLASLSLGELRQLACQLGLPGYGREDRERLTERLLKRLKRVS